jgi:hypothetical protein
MAYTTIDDPSAYFHIQLYTGDSNDDRNLTNDANAGDFKPDWLWIKERTSTSSHQLIDSTRGSSNALLSNSSNAEDVDANRVQSFLTDGFQVGTASTVNENSQTYVAWQWKANGGTTTSNSSGSNGAEADSVYQVNNTAGFSIGTYTGGGGGTFNIAIYTGLSAACEAVIVKNRDSSKDWAVGFGEKVSTSAARYLSLNNTDAAKSVGSNSGERQQGGINVNNFGAGLFDVTSGGAGDDDIYASGEKYVFYAFHSVQGYSKIGTYTGNGNADGAFVYTGFKPAWLMIKRTDAAGENWQMFDNKRDGFNNGSSSNKMLKANVSETEDSNSTGFLDLLSNGFKVRESAARHNASGGTYVYMAFAEHPFVSSKGVPVTAR